MIEAVQYVGEHVWPGRIGHFFVILHFLSALLAALSFYRVQQGSPHNNQWYKTASWSFHIHGVSLFAIMIMVFYVMINKYYEYAYVMEHVSDDLPMRYIISAFWEGQEGSFILWSFWHIFLGWFIMWKEDKKWSVPVLAVLSLVQAVLASMLLGIYIGSVKIGINPTLLLRDMVDAPIFANAEYISLLQGKGLNILLQNYWNTIHPPTLFLGFAACTIPFAYAVAGLWSRRYLEFPKKVLPWTLFAAGLLGLGILMGSAWAYEALSFGGYWAWDPVENTSLVPWMILVAGIHSVLIARATGHSYRSSFCAQYPRVFIGGLFHPHDPQRRVG